MDLFYGHEIFVFERFLLFALALDLCLTSPTSCSDDLKASSGTFGLTTKKGGVTPGEAFQCFCSRIKHNPRSTFLVCAAHSHADCRYIWVSCICPRPTRSLSLDALECAEWNVIGGRSFFVFGLFDCVVSLFQVQGKALVDFSFLCVSLVVDGDDDHHNTF